MPTDDQFGAFLEGGSTSPASDELGRLEHLRAVLGDEAMWVDPPDGLEDEVVRAIGAASMPHLDSVSSRRARKRRVFSGRVLAGIGSAAAALILVVAIAVNGDRTNSITVALIGTDVAPVANGVVTVEETGSGVSIELDIKGLEPAPDGFYYQAWIKGDRGAVTVGTFHARQSGEDIFLWSGVPTTDYPNLVITIQEEGAGPESSGIVVMTSDLQDD